MCIPAFLLADIPLPPPRADPTGRHPPQEDTPPRQTPPGETPPRHTFPGQTPPVPNTTGNDGQQAGGTHPTGTHTCFMNILVQGHRKSCWVSTWPV